MADFFVAIDELAAKYDGMATWPSEDVFNSGGITSLEMSTLWAILRHEEWDVDKHNFPIVLCVDGGAVLIQQFPSEFVTLLANSSPSQIEAAIGDWAQTEELATSPEEVAPLVEELQNLAENAETTNRSMFIWNSL